MIRGLKTNRLEGSSSPISEVLSVKAESLKEDNNMIWKDKVVNKIDGNKFAWEAKGFSKKIIDKCRYKYAGSDFKRYRQPNDIKTMKIYNIQNNVYRITMCLQIDRTGRLGTKVFKSIQKMEIFDDFDLIPESSHQTDWRRSGKDGTRWVAWKYIHGVINE